MCKHTTNTSYIYVCRGFTATVYIISMSRTNKTRLTSIKVSCYRWCARTTPRGAEELRREWQCSVKPLKYIMKLLHYNDCVEKLPSRSTIEIPMARGWSMENKIVIYIVDCCCQTDMLNGTNKYVGISKSIHYNNNQWTDSC